ncbi:MAG: hypothetical protein JNG84_10025 [Archangium sp.]|nr:hypothetical protein [Archangium sp.]
MQPPRNKRQRELALVERRKQKEERREIRKRDKDAAPDGSAGGVDPDIAHIIPGPQPIPEWMVPVAVKPANTQSNVQAKPAANVAVQIKPVSAPVQKLASPNVVSLPPKP